MAFLRNDAVNRVNIHSGLLALAQAGGGIFFLVFLLRAGIPAPVALLAQAAIQAGRFIMRPAVLPLAKRWGVRPVLIAGTLVTALQYPLLAQVHGVGAGLAVLCMTSAIGDVLYWPAYNAYFASVGDAEHRGHQISAREALVSAASIIAPLLGAWALVALGARLMFAGVGLVQALAALPMIGAPNVEVKPEAPGALRAARIGVILAAADGWFDAWFIFIWQIALYLSLGRSIAAYGGAMAFAALTGAVCGLLLGRHIDAGHGRRAVIIAYGTLAAVVVMRAASSETPWLAVMANAAGAFAMTLLSPALGAAMYNLSKASPCTMRFQVATESGWDVGCTSACLLGAALAASGAPLSVTILLALPALALTSVLLRRYYARQAPAAAV